MLGVPIQTALAEGFEFKEDVVPSGYTELRGTRANVSGTSWTTQQRLRPTLKIYPSDRLSVRLTVEAQHNQGRHDATEFVEFVDQAVQEQLDLNLAQVEELTGCHISANPAVESVEDVVSIERLFLDINQSSMDLRVGRQAIAWGSAIGINPTDVFSEFLLSEPWRERSGVDVARLPSLQTTSVDAGRWQTADRWDQKVNGMESWLPCDPRGHHRHQFYWKFQSMESG